MPDEGTLLTMVAHQYGISRNTYLVTRSRKEFELDLAATMKSSLINVEIISSMLSSALGGAEEKPDALHDPADDVRAAQEPSANHVSKSGPEMTDEGSAAWARRSMKSRRMYNWYKTSSNKKYNIINLDTRDPNEFMAGVRRFAGK